MVYSSQEVKPFKETQSEKSEDDSVEKTQKKQAKRTGNDEHLGLEANGSNGGDCKLSAKGE